MDCIFCKIIKGESPSKKAYEDEQIVAFFDIHDAIISEGELSLIYFIVFILLFLTGAGRYSLDYLIDSRFRKEMDKE